MILVTAFVAGAAIGLAGALVAVRGWPLGERVSTGGLAVGDCFASTGVPPGEVSGVTSVRLVDCSEPHHGEVYSVGELEWEAYGEEEGNAGLVDELCTDLLPRESAPSELYVEFFFPSKERWAEGDRGFVCALVGPDDSLVGPAIEPSPSAGG